jgi:hypothetical protein
VDANPVGDVAKRYARLRHGGFRPSDFKRLPKALRTL